MEHLQRQHLSGSKHHKYNPQNIQEALVPGGLPPRASAGPRERAVRPPGARRIIETPQGDSGCCADGEVPARPHQEVALWRVDYFELKTIKSLWAHNKL